MTFACITSLTISITISEATEWTRCTSVSAHKYRRTEHVENVNVNDYINLSMRRSKLEGRQKGRAPNVKNSDRCQILGDAEKTDADDVGIEMERLLTTP